MDSIQIYVDNISGDDDSRRSGSSSEPVKTADRAFSLLPPFWRGAAEIIFAVTSNPLYPIITDKLSFGMPSGPDATPLVLRGGYKDLLTVTAAEGDSGDEVVTTADHPVDDDLIGAVLTRLSGTGSPVGTAVSIRGNTSGTRMTIFLQQSIGAIAANDRFTVQRPAVILQPTKTLNVTSHDGRSPNCTFIGIKFAPKPGTDLNLLNLRVQCDTCEFEFQSGNGFVHTNARVQGGIELEKLSPNINPGRAAAGVYIHSNEQARLFSAVRDGILSGHLTFKDITVRVSQGGVFVPRTLEALRAPIHILAGGSALGQPVPRTGPFSWGTETNKARIRNVAGDDGDGLRIFNGGTLNSPAGPIHLDIVGCGRDGIRLDMGSTASFGAPGGDAGLVTNGAPNQGFGMNVRNGSRALIGNDVPPKPLRGLIADVALDDEPHRRGWENVLNTPLANTGLSLVRANR